MYTLIKKCKPKERYRVLGEKMLWGGGGIGVYIAVAAHNEKLDYEIHADLEMTLTIQL